MPLLTSLPKGLLGVMKEAARHILRRPVVGSVVCGKTEDGRYLLIRRGDTGTWAFPGGTLEWGETFRESLKRELEEEAGVVECEIVRLAGVYSRPDRDPRFHAVTVLVEAIVGEPIKPPANPVEILEARLFREEDLPAKLAMEMNDLLAVIREQKQPVIE